MSKKFTKPALIEWQFMIMSRFSKLLSAMASEARNRPEFVVLSFFAFIQIAGCVLFSWLARAPLDPNDPHYWVNAFNHLISVSMIAVILYMWVSPLKRNIGNVSKKLEKSRQKNLEIAHVLRGHINWQFETWSLTSSERDVALLSLKGLKISEIAEYRNSREGTIKAHLNAIFRKANVSSRTELLATCLESFIELGSLSENEKSTTHQDQSVIRKLIKQPI
ncbi:helix-turn-helix transcriptional regulator [Cognatishimia sp.]|uniref:helix-turn-helix transcriptional regulator n=1 Tax=Cognatishimia sp. TaxID=2211648 RepID=UPI003BAB1C30